MIHLFNYVEAAEALSIIKSGQRIFVHGSVCTPIYLLQELAKQSNRLQDVEVVSITLKGDIEIDKSKYQSSFCMQLKALDI